MEKTDLMDHIGEALEKVDKCHNQAYLLQKFFSVSADDGELKQADRDLINLGAESILEGIVAELEVASGRLTAVIYEKANGQA